jgi:hypothetical protein
MARVTTSSLISNIAGSMSGTTFQQSNAGLVMRKKPLSINPNSLPQNFQKTNLIKIQQQWIAFSNSERQAWQSFASFAKVTQKNNVNRFISGQQLFIQINSYRLMKGLVMLTNPIFSPFSLTSIVFKWSSQINHTYFIADRAIDEEAEFVCLYMSPPLSSGVMHMKTAYKNIATAELLTTNKYDIRSGYLTAYGTEPYYIQRINYKWLLVDLVTGLTSGWTYGVDWLPASA